MPSITPTTMTLTRAQKDTERRWFPAVKVAASCWLATAVLVFLFQRPVTELENKLLDVRMHLPHPAQPSEKIAYVDIDDRSINLFGRWPWKRSQLAEFIDALNSAHPSGLFVDILFSEETDVAEDIALVHALENTGNVFMGSGVQLERLSGSPSANAPLAPILKGFCYGEIGPTGDELFRVTRVVLPLSPLIAVSSGIGHMTFVPDEDGVARHFPLFVNLDGYYFPSVTFEIARHMLGIAPGAVQINAGKSVIMRGSKGGARPDIVVPVDSQMRMLINYSGPWGKVFKHYPLHALVRGLLSDKSDVRQKAVRLLENKFVILSVAFSGATDMGPTPLEPLIPLSEIHGHVISSILNQKFLTEIPSILTIAIALPLCLLLGVMSVRLRTIQFSGMGFSLVVLWILCALALFCWAGLVVDIVWPCLAISLSYGGCAGYSHWKVESERRALREAFSQYVSPAILAKILKDPAQLRLGGERVNVSVLVMVFENLERLSENAEPEEVFELLSFHYELACRCILDHGGTIDKFTKDGLIAFFGAPIKEETHLLSAVRAALAIKCELAATETSMVGRNQNMINVKMAINTGFATVGNIGSSKRMDYTIFGKTVNFCLSLAQTATAGQILVSEKTYQKMDGLAHAEDCGEIRLAPYPKPFFVFNIVRVQEADAAHSAPSIAAPTGLDRKKYIGPYTLGEKLGAGTTGAVYKGYDDHLERAVAIKILFPAMRKERMHEIKKEAKILGQLNHPNIVQVYFAGEEDDVDYLVMEFVDGMNLREILNSEGTLSPSDVLDIAIQTSRGLNAAYRKGIVHRDIKPANLLINNHDVVKITDFGLARNVTAQLAETLTVAGTFQYISPEQSRGSAVDCRSDIYSLGITLFHLLAGQPPFIAETITEMIWQHEKSVLPVQVLREKGIAEEMIELLQQMTAKSPNHRFPDYLQLLGALDKLEVGLR